MTSRSELDIDELVRLLAESRERAPGEWRVDRAAQSMIPGSIIFARVDRDADSAWIASHATPLAEEHADAIVALVNASAELLRLARIGQEHERNQEGIRLNPRS